MPQLAAASLLLRAHEAPCAQNGRRSPKPPTVDQWLLSPAQANRSPSSFRATTTGGAGAVYEAAVCPARNDFPPHDHLQPPVGVVAEGKRERLREIAVLSPDKNVLHRCCIVTPMVHSAAERRAAGPRGGAEADAQSENEKSTWGASAPIERGPTGDDAPMHFRRTQAAKRSAAPQPSRALAWGTSRCVRPPSAGGHARRGRTPCHAHTSVVQSRGEWSSRRCKRASLLASLAALRRLLVARRCAEQKHFASCAAAAPTRQTPGRRSSARLPRAPTVASPFRARRRTRRQRPARARNRRSAGRVSAQQALGLPPRA